MNGLKNGPNIFNPPEEVDSYLHKLYYDIRSPVVYGSYSKLYPHIKREGKYHVSPKYLKKWLSKQETYTTFRPARRTFQRPKVLAFTKNYQWDSDTANMVKYKSDNNEYAYFVVFIDIFTRYLYTAPLKTLRGEEMVAVFQRIIRETDETPEILRTDQGSEYKNRPFNNLLNENKIKHLYTYYETKAYYAERVIKTIKNKIMKYLSDKETLRWIEILSDLTYGYNNSIHRSIKMRPEDAKSRNQYLLWKSQYDNLNYPKSHKKQNKNPKLLRTLSNKKFKFNISERVKISHLKRMFDKEYTEKWSGEIFTIINRKLNQNIPMYELKDYNNEVIQGFFYEPELQLAYIGSDILYKIEEILKKRKKKGESRDIGEMEGMACKVQFMDSRKRVGKYIEGKNIYKAFHNLRFFFYFR